MFCELGAYLWVVPYFRIMFGWIVFELELFLVATSSVFFPSWADFGDCFYDHCSMGVSFYDLRFRLLDGAWAYV